MYGKLFSSLYTGSMIGAGPVPFALMPYVISNAVPDAKVGGQVELNSKLLSTIFGCTEGEVDSAIEFLCQPDPKSRTPDMEGRRLVKLGPYDYQVVNFKKYRDIKDEEDRREQNRVAQERHRRKKRIRDGDPRIDPAELTPEELRIWERAVERGRRAAQKKIEQEGEVEGRTAEVLRAVAESNNGAASEQITP